MTKYSVNLSFEKPRAAGKAFGDARHAFSGIIEAGVALLIFAAAFL